MKRIISVLISAIMIASLCCFSAQAITFERVVLSELGEIKPSLDYEFLVFKLNKPYGSGISLNQNDIGQAGIDYIMSILCDDNLIALDEDPISFKMDSEFSQNSIDVDFEDINRVMWTFSFDSEKIYVQKADDHYLDTTKYTISYGLYEFKDKSLYDNLIEKITLWDAEKEKISDEKSNELQTNKINITDFKFIYTGLYKDSQGELEWGVCEYIREGETKPVTMIFDSYFWTDDVKILKIKDSLADKNTYVSENKRLIKLEGTNPTSGIEYDFYFDGYLVSELKLCLDVNEDMKVESVVQTVTKTNGDVIGPYSFDMTKYTQTGTLPKELFSPNMVEEKNEDDKSEEKETPKPEVETKPDEPEKEKQETPKEEPAKEEIKEEEVPKEEITTKEETQEKPIENEEPEDKTEESEIIDFIDVPNTHWAYNEINDFAKKGIVLGYGNGYFGVDDHITYEHFALLLDRLFGYKEDDTKSVPAVREDVIVSVVKALNLDVSDVDVSVISEKFIDCDNLREKNVKYIAKAADIGLVIGSYGKLYPADYLTRAETVMLLSRALDYKN